MKGGLIERKVLCLPGCIFYFATQTLITGENSNLVTDCWYGV